MTQKFYFTVLILSLVITVNASKHRLVGYVSIKGGCDEVNNAKVTLADSLYTKTNGLGMFRFNDLAAGEYKIKVEQERYETYQETVIIEKSNSEFIVHIRLIPKQIKLQVPKSVDKYHKYFQEKKPEDVLEINIDSARFGLLGLELFTRFKNNSDSTIYVLREFKKNRVIKKIVRNKEGKMFKSNNNFIDVFYCESICGILPSDVIEIKPKQEINYPVITLLSYELEAIQEKNLVVSISYDLSKKTIDLANRFCNNDEDFPDRKTGYDLALTGEFKSVNEINFVNIK